MEEGKEAYARLTSEPTPVWAAEREEIEEVSPTFGRILLNAYTLRMVVKTSRELLEDSININTKLPEVLARGMASELDRVGLMGNGFGNEPRGAFNFDNINVVEMGANGADVESYSQILDAVEAIETDNAISPTAAIMHPRTWRAYAGLEDTTGQPLQRPEALKDMRFLTTTKIPVNQTQGTANNASTMLVGGFSELAFAIRSDIRIEVLRERYAGSFEYGFLVSLRADVGAWHEEAFAKIIGIIPA
jgi:HK97 family phage major capsid protein